MGDLALLGLGLAAAAAVGVFLWRKQRYYGRMFAEAHFREVHGKFLAALRKAEERRGLDEAPSPDNGTAFLSSAGLAVAVTVSEKDGRQTAHVSLSQPGTVTTSTVAGRFGFFLLTALKANRLELFPFFTDSRVHHLILTGNPGAWQVAPSEEAYRDYRADYAPIPFALQSVSHG